MSYGWQVAFAVFVVVALVGGGVYAYISVWRKL